MSTFKKKEFKHFTKYKLSQGHECRFLKYETDELLWIIKTVINKKTQSSKIKITIDIDV